MIPSLSGQGGPEREGIGIVRRTFWSKTLGEDPETRSTHQNPWRRIATDTVSGECRCVTADWRAKLAFEIGPLINSILVDTEQLTGM